MNAVVGFNVQNVSKLAYQTLSGDSKLKNSAKNCCILKYIFYLQFMNLLSEINKI